MRSTRTIKPHPGCCVLACPRPGRLRKKNISMKQQLYLGIFVMVIFAMIGEVRGQMPVDSLDINTKTISYIDVNRPDKSTVYEVMDGKLNLQYEDRFGHWKEFELKVFDWKSEVVGIY